MSAASAAWDADPDREPRVGRHGDSAIFPSRPICPAPRVIAEAPHWRSVSNRIAPKPPTRTKAPRPARTATANSAVEGSSSRPSGARGHACVNVAQSDAASIVPARGPMHRIGTQLSIARCEKEAASESARLKSPPGSSSNPAERMQPIAHDCRKRSSPKAGVLTPPAEAPADGGMRRAARDAASMTRPQRGRSMRLSDEASQGPERHRFQRPA